MHQGQRHLLLKIIVGLCVLLLVVVAIKDWTPTQVTVEKTVVYAEK